MDELCAQSADPEPAAHKTLIPATMNRLDKPISMSLAEKSTHCQTPALMGIRIKSPTGSTRKRVHRLGVMLGIGLTVSLLILILAGPILRVAWLEKSDLRTLDSLQNFLTPAHLPEDFALIAIDESSLDLDQTLFPETLEESPTLKAMSQGYPWPRSVYADLAEKLIAAGARKVVFDILFTGAREGDAAFAKSLAAHADRIVIGMNFERTTHAQDLEDTPLLSLPAASLLPDQRSTDPRLGFVNFWPDDDQITRSAIHRYSLPSNADKEVASLALQAVRDQLQTPLPGLNEKFSIRFADPQRIRIIPFWQVFDPAMWQQNLNGGKIFEGKTVWVGPTAQRLHDEMMIPSGNLAGPIVHMLSAAALLDHATYHRDNWLLRSALIVALSFLAVFTLYSIHRPLLGLLIVLGFGGLYVVGVWAVWEYFDLALSLIYPESALFLTGLICFGYDFALERRERSRTRGMLDRYVSRDLVREALDHEENFLTSLNGTRKPVVILFSDIRGFTTWSEKIEPEKLVAQLNEYLSAMVEVVFEHHGSVDKFIGDAVMAVWGTIGNRSIEENARLATRAALAMHTRLATLNQKWKDESKHVIRIGIGLHAGEAVFGNIGSDQKMELGVIGDVVNVASRVEGLCKKLSAGLLLTRPIATAIESEFELVSLEKMKLAGRSEEMEIYTLKILDRKPA